MSKKKKTNRKNAIDDYAMRQLRRYPPSQKSSIVKQVLMRFKVYQHPEHEEALEYLQGLPRGDVYDTIVRALLLYKDYSNSLEQIDDLSELRNWTIQSLLTEAATDEEDE